MAEENELFHLESVPKLLQRGSVRADLLEKLYATGERVQTEATVQLHQSSRERRWNRSGDYYNRSRAKFLPRLVHENDFHRTGEFSGKYFTTDLIFPSEFRIFDDDDDDVESRRDGVRSSNVIVTFCVIRQIVPETAYLYDAVHLYERSLLKALDEGRNPRNGREMVATLYGVNYRSAMGYVRDIDRLLNFVFYDTQIALGPAERKPYR